MAIDFLKIVIIVNRITKVRQKISGNSDCIIHNSSKHGNNGSNLGTKNELIIFSSFRMVKFDPDLEQCFEMNCIRELTTMQ